MKVKILTEGGGNMGLGHLSRCSALYTEILKRNVMVEFIVYGNIGEVDFLKGIPITNINWMDKKYLMESISAEEYVIVDSYKAELKIYQHISKLAQRVLYIDDIGRLDYPQGIILNPSLDISAIPYKDMCKDRVLYGPEYVILREAFRGKSKEKLDLELQRILVIMGGTDAKNIIPLIVNNICKNNEKIHFDIICGVKPKIEMLSSIENISVYENIDAFQIADLMIEADLVITAAGQTVYELLAMQVPFIPIEIIDNQKNNIAALLKYNSEQLVIHFDEINFVENLKNAIKRFEAIEYREKNILKYINLVDGEGVRRIGDVLLDEMRIEEISIRHAKREDMVFIFNLSNQDYVRQYSINKDKISWEIHVDWFNETLEDANTVFYVLTDRTKRLHGQIRYKITGASGTVSISLSETLRGRGFAKKMLKKSIEKVFDEKKG